MLRDFVSFLHALWNEWKVLLTGGSIIALVTIWSAISRNSPPKGIGWVIVGLTLIIAGFLSWRKQWLQADGRVAEINLKDVCDAVAGRTVVQAKSFVKPYLGKRVKITGILGDVWQEGLLGSLVSIFVLADKDKPWTKIQVTAAGMPRWRIRPFIPLPSGTSITVTARIREVGFCSVSIGDCELVQAHPVVPSVDQSTSTRES